MGDAVRFTRVVNNGTQEEVTNELEKVKVILNVCTDVVVRTDYIVFLSWLGATIDQWAIEHDYTAQQAEGMLRELVKIMADVHVMDEWPRGDADGQI